MYFYGIVTAKKISNLGFVTSITVPFTDQQAMMAFARLRADQGYEVGIWTYKRNYEGQEHWEDRVFY